MTDDDTPDRPDDEAAAIAGADADEPAETATDGGGPDGSDEADELPHVENPDDHAEGAFRRALDAIEEADPEDIIEEVALEKGVVDEYSDDIAVALVHGLSKQHAKAYSSKLKERLDNYTKADLIEHVEDTADKLRAEHPNAGTSGGSGSGGSGVQQPTYQPLDHWVEANLQRVVVLKTTDAAQDTTYRWHFEQGTIETQANAEGVTHFAWNYYRDELYQGLSVNTAKPERREAEAWRQWIAALIDTRGEVEETVGARSHAVENLQRHIGDSVGYTELGDAAERSGVHVIASSSQSNSGSADGDGGDDGATADTDDAPDATADGSSADGGGAATDGGASADEVRVFYTDIAKICEECGIEVRALQSELASRGYVHARLAGVSETDDANGSEVRYWVFTPDIGVPETVLTDPETPAAQAAVDSDPSATPISGSPAGGSSDNSAGHIGGIGPAPEDGDTDDDATDATGETTDATDDETMTSDDTTTDETDEQDGSAGGDGDDD